MNPEGVLLLVKLAYALGASDEINFRILESRHRTPEEIDESAGNHYPTAEAFKAA